MLVLIRMVIENRKENNAYIEKIRCVVSVNNHKGAILADETREGFHIKSGERRKIELKLIKRVNIN